MKHIAYFCGGCVLAMTMSSAHAASDWTWSGSLSLRSSYIARGIGQSDGHPARVFAAEVDWRSRVYISVWSSNVDYSASGDRHTRREYDGYAGWRHRFGRVNLDLGYAHYGYSHQPQGARAAYAEWYVRVGVPLGPVLLGLAEYHSMDFSGIAHGADYEEASVAWTISPSWLLSGAYTRSQITHAGWRASGQADTFVYSSWNAGLAWQFIGQWSAELRYWNTDAHAAGAVYGPHTALSITRSF